MSDNTKVNLNISHILVVFAE